MQGTGQVVPGVQSRSIGRFRRLVAGALVAVAVMAMVACGDDDDDNGSRSLGETTERSADIVIEKFGFMPDELSVTVGQEVTFSVANRDSQDHTFTLPFLEIDTPVPAGESATITMKVDEVPRDGFFAFYSKGKQPQGFSGKIEVEG